MKKQYKIVTFFAIAGLIVIPCKYSKAGNPDRVGQAGATELLINPWARSSGWSGSNVAGCRGLESMFLNVAGTAFTKKTELIFARTQWLKGSDINLNSFGLTQHVGETGAIGLSIMSMRFGDIPITTTDVPEGGGLGTFSPQFLNIAVSYAKGFSDNIYGGLAVKVITEKIANISARGIALDAGIQYVAGKHDQMKFGITLQNWGPKMKYTGDGLAFKTAVPATTSSQTMTVEQRAESFELPSLLSIGAGYDFYLKKDSASMKIHRITAMGTFTSCAFDKNQFKLGLEYAWKNMLMLRVGYTIQKGMLKDLDYSSASSSTSLTSAMKGPSAGFTFEVPFGKNKSTFGIDYSYRATNTFGGTHSLGARINL